MYTATELNRLAASKTSLRRQIDQRRIRCAEAMRQTALPLLWLDQVYAYWRRSGPWLRLGGSMAGILVGRTLLRRYAFLRKLQHWIPLAWRMARNFRLLPF